MRRRRAAASLNWPLVSARIERSEIKRVSDADGGDTWTLKLLFAYHPPGFLWYSGHYTESFGSQRAAEQQLLSLCELQLLVRYDPLDTSQYFMDPYRDVYANAQDAR